MTIINDWCPTCDDPCSDHATICTVCGDDLVSRPMSARGTSTTGPSSIRAIPEFMVQDLRDSNQELTLLLSNLRQRVSNIRQQVSDIRFQVNNATALPPEAMDPQAAAGRSRPTSKSTLQNLSRTRIQDNSSLLHHATVNLDNDTMTLNSVAADFGPAPPHNLRGKTIVLADPLTGIGGIMKNDNETTIGSIVYMERGDGVTFCRKALIAQDAGAVGVIIGNNTNASWPYVMKDSKGESENLRIPVIMVSQCDGRALVTKVKEQQQQYYCSLIVEKAPKECIICVEAVSTGQTVVQLPVCNHVFHEKCALMWLEHHNSCPYCRRELPTDNEEYESERRREQRTHAASREPTPSNGSTEANSEPFYG